MVCQSFLCEDKGTRLTLQELVAHILNPYWDFPDRCSMHSHRLCPILGALLFHFLSRSLVLLLCTCVVELESHLEDMSVKVYVMNFNISFCH